MDLDLEKYCDIYEISRSDMQDVEDIASADLVQLENADTLQDLKLGVQKLHVTRKLLLCTLLALDADGGQTDVHRWSAAIDAMRELSALTAKMVADLDELLSEEEGMSFHS